VLDKIIELKPKTFIYLSCNPETLARDLKVLVGGGYKIESVTPYDMFPQTNHVETLAVLKI
jgi:23S rRNA (uracil1939-C5)-methyltransferase